MVSPEKSLVRSLQRGLQIINIVAAEGPLHAKLVARSVKLPLPTAYHLLRTLVYDDYLVRLDDGTYVLGDRFQAELSALPGRDRCLVSAVGRS
ncbi:helix-turn-helix domain-containing protein [Mycobacterium sp. CVI_P3]|uniref:Helix-turn-helix domain-containing protein n=1 Tax=Mycobacterium pinniadriaticum TaxID=2994102 RepID=A0ABT3SCP5_9MYCO|nr:helix-turn-helix domain-containing protein [Mycobacterium pinniadriaticum]MCX2930847.1 helix-turn-helix domain-containing protein [Mycobacterium pinniadriaticum]MCX2937271.1 helix-turn-helix domain-containing protein [Mycobacterium pinniadriaticum]